jgi:hypothetical protein
MRRRFISFTVLLFISISLLSAQQIGQDNSAQPDSISLMTINTGWADEAVTLGYITAPSVVGLMFISAVVNEWNAGIAGIPASAMVLLAPPLIYAGGRSADIRRDISQPIAKLGWTLYAISVIPTSLALYGFTTDWGATLPLTIASGVLGTASIITMTTYAFSRAKSARAMQNGTESSLQLGLSPLAGGAMATIIYRF